VPALAAALPKQEPEAYVTTAGRAMIERMKQGNTKVTAAGPTRFDPANDPDLWDGQMA
jgi:hypothetical protein